MTKSEIVEIALRNILVKVIIGVFPKERKTIQDLVINVVIRYNANKAMTSDNIEEAVDYYKITHGIIQLVEKTTHHLLERVLDDVLQFLMQDNRILSCEVSIDKPAALKELGVQVGIRGQKSRS